MQKQLLFIDFETVYDKANKFDLRNLSMVEYVRDPRFKAFGAGLCVGENAKPRWIAGNELPIYFQEYGMRFGWKNTTVIGHNIKFDALILKEVYGIIAGKYTCTKAMSKAVLGKSIKGHALQDLAEHFCLQSKGIMKTDGLTELSAEQEKELAEYCLHDVELCREVYNRLAKDFPENQYASMHRTIDMFVNPKLQLNVPLLEKTAKEENERREKIFEEIGIPKAEFSSNVRFPALLRTRGFDVPTKNSPRQKDKQGNPVSIPALALGDPEFLELKESENEELRKLCEARVAAKSSLLETRSGKLAAIGRTGLWPFDVEFSGADQTHRFSGGSGAGGNPQNFTRDSALREAVEAPEGYSLVVGDFCVVPESKIIKADLSWVRADQLNIGDELLGFEEQLPCRQFKPSFVLGKSVKKTQCRTIKTTKGTTTVSNDHLFVVKRKLSSGGYHREWVKAFDLRLGDEIIFFTEPWEEDTSRDGGWLSGIFDGEGWISHQKIGFGQNDGVVLDTAIRLLKERGFTQIYSHKNKSGCNQVLINGGREHLRLLGMLRPVRLMKKQRSLWENRRTWHISDNLSAVVEETSFGGIREVVSLQTSTKTFISDGFFSHNCNIEMRLVAYLSKDPGLIQAIEQGVDLYCDFASVFYGRKITKENIIERRYGKTAILGLGYGCGAQKFKKMVRIQTGLSISDGDAKRAVDLYRARYFRVPKLWESLDKHINNMLIHDVGSLSNLPVDVGRDCMVLPSGLKIRFPNLRQEPGERGRMEWVYDVYNKRNLEKRKLYGGKVLENISQALAGELCKNAMEVMGDSVVGQVHDELICVAKKGTERTIAAKLKRAMSLSPKWLPEIKLEAEVGWGKTWNQAK